MFSESSLPSSSKITCFVIAAITVDGFIARDSNHLSTTWTSPEDKQWFNKRTKEAGVIVMGAKTFATIGRPLPGRFNIVYSRHPDEQLKAIAAAHPDQVLVTADDPKNILLMLEQRKFSEVAICGGSSIYTLFLKAGLITKLYLTVEPILFGKGLPLFTEEMETKLELVGMQPLNSQTHILEYNVRAHLS